VGVSKEGIGEIIDSTMPFKRSLTFPKRKMITTSNRVYTQRIIRSRFQEFPKDVSGLCLTRQRNHLKEK
jgi:hypothetical protein